jgi:chromate transport protein ChrA
MPGVSIELKNQSTHDFLGPPVPATETIQSREPQTATVSSHIGVFLPCYLFVIIPAPDFRQIAKNRQVKAFVDGVTAAATGAIAGAAFVLGRRAIIDIPTALIALATFAFLSRVKQVPEPLVILGAGVIGFIVHRYYS